MSEGLSCADVQSPRWRFELDGESRETSASGLATLAHTKVADISVLRGMPLFEAKFCNCTALTDVSPLEESRELQTVTLPPNAKNVEFLRTFPKLDRLSFTEDPSNGYRPDKTAAEFWQEYHKMGSR